MQSMLHTPSKQRLRLGLPGYLIPFAPLAFVHQRQLLARKLPSPSVFFLISIDFTPTPGIPFSSPTLKNASLKRRPKVELWIFTPHLTFRLRTLYAQ